jgi:hypothetical protein
VKIWFSSQFLHSGFCHSTQPGPADTVPAMDDFNAAMQRISRSIEKEFIGLALGVIVGFFTHRLTKRPAVALWANIILVGASLALWSFVTHLDPMARLAWWCAAPVALVHTWFTYRKAADCRMAVAVLTSGVILCLMLFIQVWMAGTTWIIFKLHSQQAALAPAISIQHCA